MSFGEQMTKMIKASPLMKKQHAYACMVATLDMADYGIYPPKEEPNLYAEPATRQITKEDGSGTKKIHVDETACVCDAVSGKNPKEGLWIGGKKYQIVRNVTENISGSDCRVVVASQKKSKGAIIISGSGSCTGATVIALYDQDKYKNQNAGSCRLAVSAFMATLIEEKL